jgi:hypothetical protein
MSTADSGDSGFLSRWSRRKAQARQGVGASEPPSAPSAVADACVASPVPDPPAQESATEAQPTAAALPPIDAVTVVDEQGKSPPPTLADVAALTRDSDFSRFVAPGVDSQVKNAALKKLFGDPQFNVMDGLDTYIDDYGKPDPLSISDLRKMTQAAFLGLIEPTAPIGAATTAAQPSPQCAGDSATAPRNVPAVPSPDEDTDLRLQSHDAAGRGGAQAGAAADDAIER